MLNIISANHILWFLHFLFLFYYEFEIKSIAYNVPSKQEKSKLNLEALKSIYFGCAILFGAIGFIWTATANRFQVYECFFIAIEFALAGFGFGSIIHGIIKLIKEK